MNKVYIVETCLVPGPWIPNSKAFVSEEKAIDVALKIMNDSNNKILARVKDLDIII